MIALEKVQTLNFKLFLQINTPTKYAQRSAQTCVYHGDQLHFENKQVDSKIAEFNLNEQIQWEHFSKAIPVLHMSSTCMAASYILKINRQILITEIYIYDQIQWENLSKAVSVLQMSSAFTRVWAMLDISKVTRKKSINEAWRIYCHPCVCMFLKDGPLSECIDTLVFCASCDSWP